ncbi:30S ribosomal protein S12 methylthiotransferase RimO [Angelakisella massiliensis]|uniref:30S ribosomal protein S12 methylthiotransferase RimO n=1 Tax=Angelakisella massiliensis TaxID=1871018 RepID=UPI0023A90308|nr:30S ribosomal protein S12 methylthiotransferase RimO [Angelakisella massiliensis]
MNPIKVGMISLGCSKNQVDAELMMAMIVEGGWQVVGDPEHCDVVIINTCGFIEDAKRESIDTILEYCRKKEEGRLRAVVVTGCLAERYQQELAQEIPETDVVLGIGKNSHIVQAIREALEGQRVVEFGPKEDLGLEGERILANPPYFAYIKVAEGCDNRCSYCAIPLIRGGFRSRSMEDIMTEVRRLAARGVREMNLVAQDTSRYGLDRYGKYMLPELIHQVCQVEGVDWVRILYAYPERITDELIDAIAKEPKVVKYIDIPVQHGSGKVLREMNRVGDRHTILALVKKLRERIPGVVIRTTMIAGFPGETQEDFEELCKLVTEARFERLGCFAYSQEEDTPAGEREDQIDPKVRADRADRIMELQMDIAFEFARSCKGKVLDVLVEGRQGGRYYGRSYMDAPDIDTRVYFTSKEKLSAGQLVPVEITGSREYDLVGVAR